MTVTGEDITAARNTRCTISPQDMLHVTARILETPLQHVPGPYLQIDQVFPAELYACLERSFPAADGGFGRWDHGGDPSLFHGNYAKRLEINLPSDLDRIDPAIRPIWDDLSRILMSPDFLRILAVKFADHFRHEFGPLADEPSLCERHLRCTMMLNRHDETYYLGPHTDRFEKIATCIFYMPERDDIEHLGTALYAHRDPNFTCRGIVHHTFENFTRIGKLPFRRNSAFIFCRTDRMFHGVEKLSASDAMLSQRRLIQMQIWKQ